MFQVWAWVRAARVAGSNTEHIALWANCSLAAAGLHEMAVTPSVRLRYDVIYLNYFYKTSVLFSQLFGPFAMLILSLSFVLL